MGTEELKEYLGIVVDMEQSIFLQNRLITDLQKRIKELQVPQVFVDPAMPTYPNTKKPGAGSFVADIIFSIVLSFASFFISGIILLIVITIVRNISGIDVEWLILLSFIVPVLFLISRISTDNSEFKNRQKNFNTTMLRYNQEMESYKQTIQQNKIKSQRDKVDRETKTLFLQSELSQVNTFLEKSQERLHTVYNKNIIFPKYRNLVAVCSLYEYICAGRCSTLEGHEGAYNIYETEMRLDRIITQLDKVIANLGAIRENQFMLYSAIQDVNKQSMHILESAQEMAGQLQSINGQAANMAGQIAELQKVSALTAYHAERTQKELTYMNRMDYLSGRNDDVFFCHPPV